MSKYFVSRNDSVSGPFTEDQVRARVASSEISSTDLIWGAGMSAWQNAKAWTVSPALGPVVRPTVYTPAAPVQKAEPAKPQPAVVAPAPAPVVKPVEPTRPVEVKPAPKPVMDDAATVVVAKAPARPAPEAETVFVAKPQPQPAAEAETVFVSAAAAAKKPSEAETIFMAAASQPKSEAETVFIGKPSRADDETVMVARKKNEPAVDIGESTKIVEGPANELWHFAIGGKSFGPFKRMQLIEELKNVDAVGEVMLWTKGMKEWAHLFEFHEILSAIGVNKRQFPRADLPGQALIKVGSRTLTAPTLTISEGGMGVKMDSGLEPGQPVMVEIQSPAFKGSIVVKADVRYIFDGVLGLKFTQIHPDAKAAVAQLVRKTTAQFVLKAA